MLNECENPIYDEFNRLTSTNDPSHQAGDIGSYTFTYDRWGSRLSQTATSGSAPSPNASINSANNQIVGLPYDAAGNQQADGNGHTFTYDAEGNLIAVDNGNTATYVYDAFNHRIAVHTASQSVEYLYDAFGRRTSTWDTASNFGILGREYWDAQQIAFRNGPTFFQHKDYLGTERIRTNYQGQLAATEQSLAYGDGLNQTVLTPSADEDNDQYAGQEQDTESNSSHAQFRQYSTTQGRWMSPDPYDGSYNFNNPQSLNRYTYVLNNPLMLKDPTGMFCEYETDADDGTLEEVDYNSSQGECSSSGGDWFPDGYGVTGGGIPLDPIYGQNPNQPTPTPGGASNNRTSYSIQTICAASALLNRGASAGLDAFGIIPGEGNLLAAAQLLASSISLNISLNSSSNAITSGALLGATSVPISAAGTAVGVLESAGSAQFAKEIAPVAKIIPVLGNFVSAASLLSDIIGKDGIVDYYNDCLAGKN